MQRITGRAARLALGASLAILVLAGFGCRQAEQVTLPAPNEDVEDKYGWVLEGPTFSFNRYPNATGIVYVTVKVKPNTLVSCTLEGEGVLGTKTDRDVSPDEQGYASCQWPVNRIGDYTYRGWVTHQNVTVETFDGRGEVF